MMLNNLLFFMAGVLTTLASMSIIVLYRKIKLSRTVILTQSLIYSTARDLFPMLFERVSPITQAQEYEDTRAFRYVELLDKAYWIEKNKIYVTGISGKRFDPTKKIAVETKNLSEERLRQLLFIISSLKNDDR
jgi:hypothetical protein